MKYMTKEWAWLMQKANWRLFVSKDAAHFSQAFYEALYQAREDARVRWEEEMSKHRQNNPPVDPDEVRKIFRKGHREEVKSLKEYLPEHILRQVADVRVLAFGYATAAVKQEITAWRKQNKKAGTQIAKAYLAHYEEMLERGDPPFLEDFGFHDSRIASCRKRGEDLVITLDNSSGWPGAETVIFEQCTVLKKDAPFINSWWETEEVYPIEGGYEIHALLQEYKCTKYIDFIVRVSGVRLIQ